MRRGQGRRRTHLEAQREMDTRIDPQKRIRSIGSGVYFIVQHHRGLLDVNGTSKTFFIICTSGRMRTVFSCHPVVSFRLPKNLCQHLCRAKLDEPQKEVMPTFDLMILSSNGLYFICLIVHSTSPYLIIALPFLLYIQVFLSVLFLAQCSSPCTLNPCLPLMIHTLPHTIRLLMT